MIRSGSHILELAADMLAVGYHLVPNTELAQLLQCKLNGDYVRVDEFQQSTVSGIYAVGDVRADSVKRVASAVGEGSVVISDIHRYLARRRLDFPEEMTAN